MRTIGRERECGEGKMENMKNQERNTSEDTKKEERIQAGKTAVIDDCLFVNTYYSKTRPHMCVFRCWLTANTIEKSIFFNKKIRRRRKKNRWSGRTPIGCAK
jgi:hypothetical protein